jgi:hypothetical protein
MDISDFKHGSKLLLGATVVFLIVSFFDWFQVNDIGFANMWHGIGFLAGLLAVALLVWEGLRFANIDVSVPIGPAMVSAFLAILTLLCTLIRFIDTPGSDVPGVIDVSRTFWAWLGLLFAILIVVFAYVNMKAAGHSITDMKNSVVTAGGAAAAAAKSSTDGDDAPAAPAAPTAPAAPAAPEAPAAPAAAAPAAAAPAAEETAEAAADEGAAAADKPEGEPPATAPA